MFKKLDGEAQLALTMSALMVVSAPITLTRIAARKTKEFAQDHPAATAVVAGVAVGAVAAPILVNGEQVDPNSLYSKMFKKN